MKLPFTLGTKLVFRLLLPGSVLATAALPLLWLTFSLAGLNFEKALYFGIAVPILGWLTSLTDMHIYMIYEGRRYWPELLREWGLKSERRRLERLKKIAEENQIEQRHRYLEATIEIAYFPLQDDGERHASYPTRLGNMIAEYEEYPTRKYGIDAAFYWYRIWISIDKDLREEIDERQSLVDGSLYLSFTLSIGAVLFLIAAAWKWWANEMGWIHAPPLEPIPLTMLAGVALGLAFVIYRLSLPAHAQFGEFFKALFDQCRSKIEVESVLDHIVEKTSDPATKPLKARERYLAAWRYLRWHKIRPPGAKKNINAETYRRQDPPELDASGR